MAARLRTVPILRRNFGRSSETCKGLYRVSRDNCMRNFHAQVRARLRVSTYPETALVEPGRYNSAVVGARSRGQEAQVMGRRAIHQQRPSKNLLERIGGSHSFQKPFTRRRGQSVTSSAIAKPARLAAAMPHSFDVWPESSSNSAVVMRNS